MRRWRLDRRLLLIGLSSQLSADIRQTFGKPLQTLVDVRITVGSTPAASTILYLIYTRYNGKLAMFASFPFLVWCKIGEKTKIILNSSNKTSLV